MVRRVMRQSGRSIGQLMRTALIVFLGSEYILHLNGRQRRIIETPRIQHSVDRDGGSEHVRRGQRGMDRSIASHSDSGNQPGFTPRVHPEPGLAHSDQIPDQIILHIISIIHIHIKTVKAGWHYQYRSHLAQIPLQRNTPHPRSIIARQIMQQKHCLVRSLLLRVRNQHIQRQRCSGRLGIHLHMNPIHSIPSLYFQRFTAPYICTVRLIDCTCPAFPAPARHQTAPCRY